MDVTRRSVLGSLPGVFGLATGANMTTPRRPRGLGIRQAVGQQDSPLTGNINPYLPGTGWVVVFTPDLLPTSDEVSEFEVYQIAMDGPIGSSAVIMLDLNEHSYAQTAWANTASDEPAMLVRTGQTIQFCWNVAFTAPPYNRTTNIRPRVTLWLRRLADTGVFVG